MVTLLPSPLRCSLIATACAIATLGLSACEDNHAHDVEGGTAYHHRDIDPKEVPPHNGMTRDEVYRMYGEPYRKYVDDMGETWVYQLNAGEVIGKSFIPFYIPPRLRVGVLTFGPGGRVVRYRWQPDSHQAAPQNAYPPEER